MGSPLRPLRWRQQIIAWKVLNHRLLLIAGVNDGIDQPQGVWAFDLPSDQRFEDFQIYTREIFLDVALQAVAVTPSKLGKAF